MRPLSSLVLAALCAVVSFPSPSSALDVTTCGQLVPPGELGVLVGDLDCSARPAGTDGVTLSRGSALDLQGHTLVGPPWSNLAQNAAARCRFGNQKCHVDRHGIAKCKYPKGTCRVFSSVGTGTIMGGAAGAYSHNNLVLENLAIDVTNVGVFLNPTGKLVAANVAVTSTGGIANGGGGDMLLTNVSSNGSLDCGIFTGFGSKIRGSNVTVTDNARCGILAGRVTLDGLTATGNGNPTFGGVGGGVYAGRIVLTNSTVTGNFYSAPGTDVISGALPKLVATTCGTSHNTRAKSPAEESWGVCAND